jgi:hypothetical protein
MGAMNSAGNLKNLYVRTSIVAFITGASQKVSPGHPQLAGSDRAQNLLDFSVDVASLTRYKIIPIELELISRTQRFCR